MNEFQFYKKRNFSAYINDTMQFFKLYGKDYFKTYLSINALLLLLMCVISYFTFKDMFSNMSDPTLAQNLLFSDGNIGFMILLLLLLFVVSIIISITNIGQPIIYTKIVEKTGRTEIATSEILDQLFKIALRFIVFGVISMFILMPVFIILIFVGALLSIILVGIPILIIGIPAVMVWSMQALIVYVNEERGYFESLKKAWKILFSDFWHIVGSSMVVYILISVIQSGLTMIPYFIALGSFISSGANPGNFEFPPLMIFMYVAGILITYILLNAFYIQQCLVYYSAVESTEHIQAINEIDNIGKNEA